jgi:hypothetical protein
MLKLSGPSSDAGMPPVEVRRTLKVCGPVCSMAAVADASMPSTFTSSFTLSGPAAEILRPGAPAASAAEARSENAIRPVPVTWVIVPLWKPELSTTSVASAIMLSLTGPSFTWLAVMWMWSMCLRATCVRKGNPSMVTSGLVGNPWLFIWSARPSPQAVAAQPVSHASPTASARATGHGSARATKHPSSRATPAGKGAKGAVPPVNDEASSLLLILVICACFAGAFNAVRELVKERAIYSRERAAGLSTASYLSSKLAVLGLISGLQAGILVLIGLFGRKLPVSGSLLHSLPLLELIIAMALLAIVSMALGLLISASVNTSEKTMPILMVVVVVEVILTGGVFAIAGKAGLEQVAWLSPSRWGYALTASTTDLNKIFPPAPGNPVDHLWAHTPQQWLTNMLALAALGVIFAVLAWWRLVRQGPARRA